MSTRKALVDADGTVENVIEYDPKSDYELPDGLDMIDASDAAEPGGTWDGTEFHPADRQGPVTISERVEALENATGVGEDTGTRGIATRLDDLEDRIKALEG